MVDVSQLIKDERDILSTQKLACIVKDEAVHNLILSSPPESLLGRIYEKSRLRPEMAHEKAILNRDHCVVGEAFLITKLMFSDVFIAEIKSTMDIFFAASYGFGGIFKKLWISEKPIHEFRMVAELLFVVYQARLPLTRSLFNHFF